VKSKQKFHSRQRHDISQPVIKMNSTKVQVVLIVIVAFSALSSSQIVDWENGGWADEVEYDENVLTDGNGTYAYTTYEYNLAVLEESMIQMQTQIDVMSQQIYQLSSLIMEQHEILLNMSRELANRDTELELAE